MYRSHCPFCVTMFLSGSPGKAPRMLAEHIERTHPEYTAMGREARTTRTVREMFDRELERTNAGRLTRWLVRHPRTTRAGMFWLAPLYFLSGHGAQWSHHRELLKLLATSPDERIEP